MEDNPKLKCTMSKGNEKRSVHHQSEPLNTLKISSQIVLRNDSSPLKSSDSPVKKVLSEANKIIKIGMAKEIALYEKDNAIQNSSETIDNLRRNILKLQMEHEKLDQNYQNEISHRTELIKRMETTRHIAESAAQYCNVLVKSVKDLEEDKHKLAEFYEIIICNQENIEEKHKTVEKQIKDIDDILANKINAIRINQENMILENTKILTERDRELLSAQEKLQLVINEKENLYKNIEELKSSNILQEEKIYKLKNLVQKMTTKSTKQKKFWKIKRTQFLNIKKKCKKISNKLHDAEASFAESQSFNNILEKEKNELRDSVEEQKLKFENYLREWESGKEEHITKLKLKEKEIEELKIKNIELNKKISEFEKKTIEWMEKENKEKLGKDQLQENYFHILEENRSLKAFNDELSEQNNNKEQLILDYESKLNMYDHDFKSRKSFFKIESQRYEETVKTLESKIKDVEEKLSAEKFKNEKFAADWEKIQNEKKLLNEKIEVLEKSLTEKLKIVEKLEVEKNENFCLLQSLKTENQNLTNIQSSKEIIIFNLKEDYMNSAKNNEELIKTLKNEQNKVKSLTEELQKANTNLMELDKQLKEEQSSKKILKEEKIQLEMIKENLKKEIENKREVEEELKQTKIKLEEESKNLMKVSEENLNMKTTVKELKCRLQETEDRIEALKVLLKEAESDKIQSRENQNREIYRLKSELAFLQDSIKKDGNIQNIVKKSSRHEEQPSGQEADISSIKKLWEKVRESASMTSLQKFENKENEATAMDSLKSHPGSTTPTHNNKRFLSTPRKILTSTPQSRIQNITPVKKKRDPYEFDSDGSVERLDADQTLRAFNSRSKKDSASKKPKTKNF